MIEKSKNRLRLAKVIVKNKMSRFMVQCVYERSCCACCVCYDRLSSEHVLVITSSTPRARHKYSWAPPTSRKKIGLGCADFLHSGTGSIEIAVFVLWLIFSYFFRTSTARSEKSITISITIFWTHPFYGITQLLRHYYHYKSWRYRTVIARNYCQWLLTNLPSFALERVASAYVKSGNSYSSSSKS